MATIASNPSATASVTLGVSQWWLSDPTSTNPGLAVSVTTDWSPSQARIAGTFYPVESNRAIVVWGDQYGIEGALSIRVLNRANYDAVKALLLKNSVILLRDVWGNAYYISVVSGVAEAPMRAAPVSGETWPLRHAHELTVNVVETAAP